MAKGAKPKSDGASQTKMPKALGKSAAKESAELKDEELTSVSGGGAPTATWVKGG